MNVFVCLSNCLVFMSEIDLPSTFRCTYTLVFVTFLVVYFMAFVLFNNIFRCDLTEDVIADRLHLLADSLSTHDTDVYIMWFTGSQPWPDIQWGIVFFLVFKQDIWNREMVSWNRLCVYRFCKTALLDCMIADLHFVYYGGVSIECGIRIMQFFNTLNAC